MISLDRFKAKLADKTLSDKEIVQKYITDGEPFIFKDDKEPGKYFKLKNLIGRQFKLNPHEVIMIGSAKLGFSIAPHQLWKPFDEDSDIDMVILSATIFDRFWKELYEFNINLAARTEEEDGNYRKFLDYFFKGWIRPDLLPFNYTKRKWWFDFLSRSPMANLANTKLLGQYFGILNFTKLITCRIYEGLERRVSDE